MSGIYLDIQTSLLAYCYSVINRYNLTTFQSYDFDAHAAAQELPDSDLLGIGMLSIENTKDQYIATGMIIVCTQSDDAQLLRLRNAVDVIFSELKPTTPVPHLSIIDVNGTPVGKFTVIGDVMVHPVSLTKTRPLIYIATRLAVGY